MGIPTKYNGVNFRSRLEARWAAFFDLIGWRWEYEPIDLEGYIPDFILHLASPILAEVKPEVEHLDLIPHTKKIQSTSWRNEALIVGASVFEESVSLPEHGAEIVMPFLGILWSVEDFLRDRREGVFCGYPFAFLHECLYCKRWSIVQVPCGPADRKSVV